MRVAKRTNQPTKLSHVTTVTALRLRWRGGDLQWHRRKTLLDSMLVGYILEIQDGYTLENSHGTHFMEI